MQYMYSLNIKLSEIAAKTSISTIFPNVEDLLASSKKFESYEAAADSASKVFTEIKDTLNKAANADKFALLSEVNPKHSHKETISKDWGQNELAKLWIVDRAKQEKAEEILAVGMAQLLEVHGESVTLN